jgi:hypothetical protein
MTTGDGSGRAVCSNTVSSFIVFMRRGDPHGLMLMAMPRNNSLPDDDTGKDIFRLTQREREVHSRFAIIDPAAWLAQNILTL